MKRGTKHQNLKEHIIKSIFLELEHIDYKELTSEQIADVSDISKRTLYKYFKSKDEMYLALIWTSFAELNSVLEQSLIQKHLYDKSGRLYKVKNMNNREFFKKVILALGETYLEFLIKNPLKGQMIVNYNEMAFIQNNREVVLEIAAIANRFELTKIIARDQIVAGYEVSISDKQPVIERDTAIFCWSSIQGFATLLMNKESWMTQYYESSREELISHYLTVIEKVIGGLLNE